MWAEASVMPDAAAQPFSISDHHSGLCQRRRQETSLQISLLVWARAQLPHTQTQNSVFFSLAPLSLDAYQCWATTSSQEVAQCSYLAAAVCRMGLCKPSLRDGDSGAEHKATAVASFSPSKLTSELPKGFIKGWYSLSPREMETTEGWEWGQSTYKKWALGSIY